MSREWWCEVLEYRTRIGKPLTSSWKDLRQSLIMELIQDGYEEILYWIDKQIYCYYLPFVQLSYIAMRKIWRYHLFLVLSRQVQHHLNDNNTVENTSVLVHVSSTNSEEEIKEVPKLVSCSDSQGLETQTKARTSCWNCLRG